MEDLDAWKIVYEPTSNVYLKGKTGCNATAYEYLYA